MRGAHAVVRADQIRLHEVVETVAVAPLVGTADAAVCDERVDRAVRVDGCLERRVDGAAVADVELPYECAADLVCGLPERVNAAREDAERRAVACEALRDRLTDPATCSRDDDVPAQCRPGFVMRNRALPMPIWIVPRPPGGTTAVTR